MEKKDSGVRWFEDSEIISHVALCNGRGNLNPAARGWSRIPLQTCNLSRHFPRKKRWNYWCITGKDCLFSITISDIDYAGLIFACFLDFKTNTAIEKTITVPLGKDVYLGDTVLSLCSFQSKEVDVQFVNDEQGVSISLSWMNFAEGMELSGELSISVPKKHETLNVLIPWNDSDLFQFTSKQNCLPVTGFFSFGNTRYEFKPKESFGCLDFGRGIWPYTINWNRGSFSGYSGNNLIGVNMGAQWTDGTGITENAVCLNGRLFKIKENVVFTFDRNDFMKPWTVRTETSDSVDLVMTPFYERYAHSSLLVVKSATHQMFGHYSGTVVAGKKKVTIDNIVGWAEDHSARW